MKYTYIRRILVVFSFVLLTGLFVFAVDLMQKKSYTQVNNKEVKHIEINFNSQINKDILNKWVETSKEYNIDIIKTQLMFEDNEIINQVFLSTSTNDFLEKQNLPNKESNSHKKAGATFRPKTQDLKYHIYDILNNDRYIFMELSEYFNADNYPFSNYNIYYDNENSFNQFIENSNLLLFGSLSVKDNQMNTSTNPIIMLPAIILGVFFVIYYVIEIFSVYNLAGNIAIMKMQGLSIIKIFWKIFRLDIFIYVFCGMVAIILSCLITRGYSYLLILSEAVGFVLIIFSYIIISFICVCRIIYKKNVVELLKNNRIIKKMVHTNIVLQLVLGCLVLVFLANTFTTTESIILKNKTFKNVEDIINFAYFPHINENNEQVKKDKSNLNRVYERLPSTDIQYEYSTFINYKNSGSSNDIQMMNSEIENGTFFPIASVDSRYLAMNNIDIFDASGAKVDLENLQHEVFLFPEGCEEYYSDFVEYYKEDKSKYEERMKIETDYSLYVYKGELLDYIIGVDGNRKVNSPFLLEKPILRLIYNKYPVNYLNDSYGINIAGTGNTTALKFDLGDLNKENFYQLLYPILKEEKVEQILPYNLLTTIGDVMNDEIKTLEIKLYIEGTLTLLIVIIFIAIMYQAIQLYIERDIEKISVKTFLGFSMWKIYKQIYSTQMILLTIPMITVLILSIIKFTLNFKILMLINFVILFIFHLIFYFSVKKVNVNNVSDYLRGDY